MREPPIRRQRSQKVRFYLNCFSKQPVVPPTIEWYPDGLERDGVHWTAGAVVFLKWSDDLPLSKRIVLAVGKSRPRNAYVAALFGVSPAVCQPDQKPVMVVEIASWYAFDCDCLDCVLGLVRGE